MTGFDYSQKMKSIGQVDSMACWAACLEWWTTALARYGNSQGRYGQGQLDLIGKYIKILDDNGGISMAALEKIGKDPLVNCKWQKVTSASFKDFNLTQPVLVAFSYPKVGGYHMNVVFGLDDSKVMAMEPYHPFPGEDGKRTGKYESRSVSFYTTGSEVIVGYAPASS